MPHLLLVLLCLLLVAPDAAWSAASGRIEGVAQQEGKAIANHRIMLIRFGPGEAVDRTPGETDAAGAFAFEGLETGEAYRYVVGIRYEGQLFRSESLQLSENETKRNVALQVGAGGTPALGAGAAQVNMPHQIMAIVLRDGHLEVREVVTIQNPGSAPYRGAASGGHPYVLHLPLPEGYDKLRDIGGVEAQHLRSEPAGLFLTQPLAPGTHRLTYTYELPMPSRVRTLLFRHSLPTGVIDVLADAKRLAASSNLQFAGEVPIESHTFLHYRGVNPEAGARQWVQITRLGAGVSRALRIASATCIVAIALAGLALPLYNVWRRRSRASVAAAPSAEDIRAWRAEQSQLLTAIAQLDDEHAAGALDASAHRQRRQAYKQQLRQVAEALRQAPQPLDAPPLVTHKEQP